MKHVKQSIGVRDKHRYEHESKASVAPIVNTAVDSWYCVTQRCERFIDMQRK